MFGWATQIAKTAVSEAASLGKAYVDTVIGDDETEEEYYARVAREREAHTRGGNVGDSDEGIGGAVTSTNTHDVPGGGTPSSGSSMLGGGAAVQRIGEMPKLHQPTAPTTAMQSTSSLTSSTLEGPINTTITSSPAPSSASADTMLRHNRFIGGAGKKVGLNKGLGVTRGLAAAPPISSTTTSSAAPVEASGPSTTPRHQKGPDTTPTVKTTRMCEDSDNSSIASYSMDTSQSRVSPVVSTPTRTHQPFVPSPSSGTARKPSSSLLSSSGLRIQRQEPTSSTSSTKPATTAPPPVEDLLSSENLEQHQDQGSPTTPVTVTPTTPVPASSFTVGKPTLTTTGLATRKPAVARKVGLGLGGGSSSIKSGLGLGGGSGISKLGSLRAAPPLSLSSTVTSTTPQNDKDMGDDDEKTTTTPLSEVPPLPSVPIPSPQSALPHTAHHPVAAVTISESPSKPSSSPVEVMVTEPSSAIWSALDQHYPQVGGTQTTTNSTIRSAFLGAYEALIEVAFLANDDASSPHTLKDVYTRTIASAEAHPATSALIATLSPSPLPPSLPKMGAYLTSLQKLFDTINNNGKECESVVNDVNMDAVLMRTFVASMEAISELAEHYDDCDDTGTSGGSHHIYTCMRDALSTQERILLDTAVIVMQQRSIGGRQRCAVAVPLLVLTQKLLWAM